MFYKYLDKSKIYFEFGSGGSTYQACSKNNILKVYSVESDKEWHDKLKKIITTDKIQYIYNEMDTQPNNWGMPGPNSTILQQISYSDHIKNISENDKNKIDFILIDGRFRVACCLKCFDIINEKCFIAFDDFLKRPYYSIVLNYYDIIEQTIDKKMVILKKKSNIKYIPNDLIKKYELIKE